MSHLRWEKQSLDFETISTFSEQHIPIEMFNNNTHKSSHRRLSICCYGNKHVQAGFAYFQPMSHGQREKNRPEKEALDVSAIRVDVFRWTRFFRYFQSCKYHWYSPSLSNRCFTSFKVVCLLMIKSYQPYDNIYRSVACLLYPMSMARREVLIPVHFDICHRSSSSDDRCLIDSTRKLFDRFCRILTKCLFILTACALVEIRSIHCSVFQGLPAWKLIHTGKYWHILSVYFSLTSAVNYY